MQKIIKNGREIVSMCKPGSCCPCFEILDDGFVHISDDFGNEVKIPADLEDIQCCLNEAFETYEDAKKEEEIQEEAEELAEEEDDDFVVDDCENKDLFNVIDEERNNRKPKKLKNNKKGTKKNDKRATKKGRKAKK